MNRTRAFVLSLAVGLAAVSGLFALASTVSLGQQAHASGDAQIVRRTAQLNRYEASLRKALAQKPPPLPPLPDAGQAATHADRGTSPRHLPPPTARGGRHTPRRVRTRRKEQRAMTDPSPARRPKQPMDTSHRVYAAAVAAGRVLRQLGDRCREAVGDREARPAPRGTRPAGAAPPHGCEARATCGRPPPRRISHRAQGARSADRGRPSALTAGGARCGGASSVRVVNLPPLTITRTS